MSREWTAFGGCFIAVSVLALAGGMDGSSGSAQAAPARFDLEEATVSALLRDQEAGRRSARQIAEAYLARIRALDRNGPTLRAVIELNPDALAIADALDAERRLRGPRGPLHGVPVLIKDNIDTADRMSTTVWIFTRVSRRNPLTTPTA